MLKNNSEGCVSLITLHMQLKDNIVEDIHNQSLLALRPETVKSRTTNQAKQKYWKSDFGIHPQSYRQTRWQCRPKKVCSAIEWTCVAWQYAGKPKNISQHFIKGYWKKIRNWKKAKPHKATNLSWNYSYFTTSITNSHWSLIAMKDRSPNFRHLDTLCHDIKPSRHTLSNIWRQGRPQWR